MPPYIQRLLGSRTSLRSGRALGNPRRDWHIVLISSGAVFVIWMGVAAALFFVEGGSGGGGFTPPPQATVLNSAHLEALLQRYRGLGEEHALIRAAPAPFEDPSLSKQE